jgi:hypothetical protein
MDSLGGEQVARDMAKEIVTSLGDNWSAYPSKWMEVNKKYPLARAAAAIDKNGYWYLNAKTEPASHTHEERPLPGYDPTLGEREVVFSPKVPVFPPKAP